MPERASVFDLVQIGVESTPGTAVAATKKLLAVSVEPDPQAEVAQFRPRGLKHMTVAALTKEWMAARLTGQPTYTELVYLLSSLLTTAAITTPGGATNARKWTFAPSSSSADSPKTFTIEQGAAAGTTRAHRFAHALVNALTLSFSRNAGVGLTGSLLGRRIEDGITPTTGLSGVALVPVLPTQVDVYVDTTSGGLGTTKLTRAFDAEWSVGGRYGPLWVLNSAQPSFTTTVETPPDVGVALHVEADAEGMGFLTQLRSGDTRFIRIEATGPEVEAGQNYKLRIDLAAKVVGIADFGNDIDGVVATGWNWAITHDDGWGKAYQVEVTNGLTAL